jgi:acyl carrier protein
MNASLATKVRGVIAGHFGIDADRILDGTRLREDLGADWLDRLELMIVLEERMAELDINRMAPEQIETVGDLMRAIEDASGFTRPRAMDESSIGPKPPA